VSRSLDCVSCSESRSRVLDLDLGRLVSSRLLGSFFFRSLLSPHVSAAVLDLDLELELELDLELELSG